MNPRAYLSSNSFFNDELALPLTSTLLENDQIDPSNTLRIILIANLKIINHF